jgi:hypothetical protein
MLLHVIIVDEHLLRDVLSVQLVRHDIRWLSVHITGFTIDFVFLTDDGCTRVHLFQIVDDRVLDMDICFGEDISAGSSFSETCEVGGFTHFMDDFISALQQLDAG